MSSEVRQSSSFMNRFAADHGQVIAQDMSCEQYITRFDGQHVEWVDGNVVAMSPISTGHNHLTSFLHVLLELYRSVEDSGRVCTDPMVMRPLPNLPAGQPDLQVGLQSFAWSKPCSRMPECALYAWATA
ncbi:MAG: hypothetical protein SF162_16130 [bacterium]|nr:hypothetical protein [bacterium]